MNVSLDPHDRWSTPPRLYRLWAGVLLAPIAWVVHLGVAYAMSSAVCPPGALWAFLLLSGGALALALGGGWIAWGVRERSADEPVDAPTSRARGRFMTLAGLLLSALFALAILAQTIPMFLLEPCRY